MPSSFLLEQSFPLHMISLPSQAKNSDRQQPDQLWFWVVQDHILSMSGGFCRTGKVTDKTKSLFIIEFRMYFSRSFLCLHNALFPYLYHLIIFYSLSWWEHKSPVEGKGRQTQIRGETLFGKQHKDYKDYKRRCWNFISKSAHWSYLPSGSYSLSGIQRLFCTLTGLEE